MLQPGSKGISGREALETRLHFGFADAAMVETKLIENRSSQSQLLSVFTLRSFASVKFRFFDFTVQSK